jgi:hypothetical protein
MLPVFVDCPFSIAPSIFTNVYYPHWTVVFVSSVIYEKTDMGIKIFVWWCLMKSLGIVFYFLAQFCYKAPKENNKEEGTEQLMHPIEKLNDRSQHNWTGSSTYKW